MGTRAGYPTPNQDMGHLSPVSNSATNTLFSFSPAIHHLCVFSLKTVKDRMSVLGHVYSGSGTRGLKFDLELHVSKGNG